MTSARLDGVALDAADVLSNVAKEGKRVGVYVLVRQLGVGGMGEFCRATWM